MAQTQQLIALLAETQTGADPTRTIRGIDVSGLIKGEVAIDQATGIPFRYAPADTQNALVNKVVKPAVGVGNWIQFGLAAGGNPVSVFTVGDLPAPSGGVITLLSGVTYLVYGSVNIGTNRLSMQDASRIEGVAGGEIIADNAAEAVSPSASGNAIEVVNLDITNLNGAAASWTGTGNGAQAVFEGCTFTSTGSGLIVTGVAGDTIYVGDNRFRSTVGLEVGGVWNAVSVVDNHFVDGDKGILITCTINDLAKMLVSGNEFNVINTANGVFQNNADAVDEGRLVGNMFFGAGTYISANVATAEWVGVGNVGVANF